MKLSTDHIKSIQTEGNLKKFATWFYLKNLYSNGCIFKYNIASLSKKSGLSRNLIRSHISFFLKKKWCRIHCNNLIFINISKTYADTGLHLTDHVNLFKGKTIKQIKIILLSLVLKKKEVQFNFIKKVNRDLNISRNLKVCKKAIKLRDKYKISSSESGNFKMKLSTIGKSFNCSKSTAYNMIKEMKEMKLVKIKSFPFKSIGICKNYVFESIKDIFINNNNSGIFYYNNRIFNKKCNEYMFL